MTLQKVAEFTRDAELNRRLRDLQENVATALDASSGGTRPRVLIVQQAGTIVRLGDLAIVAPGFTLELVLAEPPLTADGQELSIVKQSAGGTITVRPASGRVNGAATQSLTSVGIYRYVAARGSYWRHP